MPPEYLRTNYRLTGEILDIPEALQSIIIQDSGAAGLSSAGYFFDSLGGYGAPSIMFFEGLSDPEQCASVKGDGDESTMAWFGFGVGSFSGSVYFVTALVAHYGMTANNTMSVLGAADAWAAASTSISAKILYRAIIGSR